MDIAANSRSHRVSRGQEEEDLHRDFTSGRPTALRNGLPGFEAVLVIPEPLLDRVLASARSGAPEEVCGWLAGEGGRVEQIYPVPNVAESGFRMHPEAQLSAMRNDKGGGPGPRRYLPLSSPHPGEALSPRPPTRVLSRLPAPHSLPGRARGSSFPYLGRDRPRRGSSRGVILDHRTGDLQGL